MSSNTYILAILVDTTTTQNVGALGDVAFEKGWYGYVGSSRDASFGRLERHRDVSDGQNDTRHWHIDYLLGMDESKLYGSFVTTDASECDVARSVSTDSIDSFGCSDCDCNTHLKYSQSATQFASDVRDGLSSLTGDFLWVEAHKFSAVEGL